MIMSARVYLMKMEKDACIEVNFSRYIKYNH